MKSQRKLRVVPTNAMVPRTTPHPIGYALLLSVGLNAFLLAFLLAR